MYSTSITMKYIMYRVKMGGYVRDIPVIFPDSICHDDMAVMAGEAVRMHSLSKVDVKSAGFLNLRVDATFDKSETLGLAADERDAAIINLYDYHHGVV